METQNSNKIQSQKLLGHGILISEYFKLNALKKLGFRAFGEIY